MPRIVAPRLLLAAALLAPLALAAPAPAQWSAAFTLSAAGDYTTDPDAAVDPSGAAVVVWRTSRPGEWLLQARRVAADGTLRPVVDVSPPGDDVRYATVAVDPAGTATIAWFATDDPALGMVRARRLGPDGTLHPIHDVSPLVTMTEPPRVVIGPDGAATIVWSPHKGTEQAVFARRVDAAGNLEDTIHTLAEHDRRLASLDVAGSASGRTAVAWTAQDRSDLYRVHLRTLNALGEPGRLELRSPDGEDARDARVAYGPAAIEPLFLWRRAPEGTIRVRMPGPVRPFPVSGEDCRDAELGVDAAGAVTAAFECREDSAWVAFAARADATGRTMPAQALSPPSPDDTEPHVAVEPGGDATLAWRWQDDLGGHVLRARRLAADGTAGAVVDLTPPSLELTWTQLRAGGGRALLVWGFDNGSEYQTDAARYVPTLPPPAELEPPGPGEPEPPLMPPLPPAPPASPATPVTTGGCAAVVVERLRSHAGRPRRSRPKSVAATLVLSAPGRVDVRAARLAAGTQRVKLMPRRFTATTRRPVLRFRLPARARRELAIGRRVTLKLTARARGTGCAYGPARTLTVRTKVTR